MRRATIILLALLLAGCGYGFRGTVSYLPRELKTIAIPFLQNETNESGLEITVTQALIREINRSKLLKLAETGRADVVLKGRIRALNVGAVTFEDIRTALQRRVIINVDLELTRTDNRRVLWRRRGMTEGQDYDVSGDALSTEDNRQAAVEQLAKNLAARVHDAIFENF